MGASVIPDEVWNQLFALDPGATFESYFEALVDSRTLLTRYMAILEGNPAFHHLAQSLDSFQGLLKKWNLEREALAAAQRAEEKAKAQAGHATGPVTPDGPLKPVVVPAVQMFTAMGKTLARDTLATLRMQTQAKPSPLPRYKKDREKFLLTTTESVAFARKVESFTEDRRWANSEMAYFAGLVYDWSAYRMSLQKSAAAKDGRAMLDTAFAEGMKIAQVAYGISTHYKNLKHAERVFGAALLIPLGKAWCTWLLPKSEAGKGGGYKEFMDRCNGSSNKRELWKLLEKRRFPITHNEFSGLIAGFSIFFQPVEKAIAHYQEPYLLKKASPEQYQVARILQAASVFATSDLLKRFDFSSPRVTRLDHSIIEGMKELKTEHWTHIGINVKDVK